MFQELNNAIREEVVTLLFHAEVTPDDGPRPSSSSAGAERRRQRLAQLRARVARRRRRDPRAPAPRPPPAAGAAARSRRRSRRSRRSTPSSRTSAATIPAGAARARSSRSATAPERPLTPPDPPLADDLIRLEPLSSGTSSRLPDVSRTRHPPVHDASRPSPTAPFVGGWVARYERRLGRGSRAGFALSTATGDRSVSRRSSGSTSRREGEIGYLVAAEARGRGIAGRSVALLTRWGFDELGLERIELRIDSANAASARVAEAGGLPPGGRAPLEALQGRPPRPTSGSGPGCVRRCQRSRLRHERPATSAARPRGRRCRPSSAAALAASPDLARPTGRRPRGALVPAHVPAPARLRRSGTTSGTRAATRSSPTASSTTRLPRARDQVAGGRVDRRRGARVHARRVAASGGTARFSSRTFAVLWPGIVLSAAFPFALGDGIRAARDQRAAARPPPALRAPALR